MKSGDASLHIIATQRKLLPKAELDSALREAGELNVPFEHVLRRRGVPADVVDACIRVRARHGYPCEKCGLPTFLLPGETREAKPCERCGGSLCPAPIKPVELAPPPAVAPAPEPIEAIAKAPPREPTFGPPPSPPVILVQPPPPGSFQLPVWVWTIGLLLVIWTIGGIGPFASAAPDEEIVEWEEPVWPLDASTRLMPELEPSPARAVKTKISLAVCRDDETPFEGEASYRIQGDRGDAPWITLAADPDGVIRQAAKTQMTFDADRALVTGPCHLQFKVKREGESEGRVFDWKLTVRDAQGRLPSSHRVPVWARYVIAFLALMYLGTPIIVRFTTTFPSEPRLTPIDPTMLRQEVEAYLAMQSAALVNLGYERVAVIDFPTGKNTFYLARLVDRANGDMALVSVLVMGSGQVKAKQVGFVTRYASGAAAETTNSPIWSELYPRPSNRSVKNVREQDLSRLQRIHQGVAAEVGRGATKVLPEPGRELEQLAAAIVEPAVYAAEKGFLWLDRGAGLYKPTVFGAFIMTWKMLPPYRQVALMKRQAEETRLRTAYG